MKLEMVGIYAKFLFGSFFVALSYCCLTNEDGLPQKARWDEER